MTRSQTFCVAVAGLVLAVLGTAIPAAHVKAAGAGPALARPSHARFAANGHEPRTMVLVRSTFKHGAGAWPTTKLATVSHGRYTVVVAVEHYAQYSPSTPRHLGNGIITAAVQPVGDGAAGLMARFHSAKNGAWSMYACWISNNRTFGCLKDINDTRTPIAPARWSAAIKRNATNSIMLMTFGNRITFRINGVNVGRYTDTLGHALPGGAWGVYADNNTTGPFRVHYDTIVIRHITG